MRIRGSRLDDEIVEFDGDGLTIEALQGDDLIRWSYFRGFGEEGDRTTLNGGRGDDTIEANGTEAYLYGGSGDDVLAMGAEGDYVADGGPGADRFDFSGFGIYNHYEIVDFHRLEGDVLVGFSRYSIATSIGVGLCTNTDPDVRNSPTAYDIFYFTDDGGGAAQRVTLYDAWSASNAAFWDATFGVSGLRPGNSILIEGPDYAEFYG